MANEHPFYLAGQWHRSNEGLPVTNPWDDSVIGSTWLASEAQVEEATAATAAAAGTMRSLPAYERGAILAKASSVLSRRRTEIGRALAGEAGKPIRDALSVLPMPRQLGDRLVTDVPTWRIDHMPYGGVKDSGVGREGPRYAIEEMTEPKLLVINTESRS